MRATIIASSPLIVMAIIGGGTSHIICVCGYVWVCVGMRSGNVYKCILV